MLNDAVCFKQVYIVTSYNDLRSEIDRLAALITSKTGDNPFVPDTLYLFCGRKTNHQVPVPGKNYRKVIWCNKMKIISIAAVTAGGKTTIGASSACPRQKKRTERRCSIEEDK